jgi:acyl carrier protein
MSDPDGVHPSPTRADVEKIVRSATAEVMMIGHDEAEQIAAEEPDFLLSRGGTSIDALELIVSVEERLGFEFEDGEMGPDLVQSLKHFVERVCERLRIAPA